MRIRLVIFGLLVCGWLAGTTVRADTFKLTDGRTLTGELLGSAANDAGVKVKVAEGQYESVPWASFSQEDLKRFAANRKMEPLVEPFIEVSQEQKMKKTEVLNITHAPRLERPEAHSLFGALGSSGLGLFILLLLYAGNLYAAYEISIFRAQSPALVCGVSAALPLIGPIIFLSMPTKLQPTAPTWETAPEAPVEAVSPVQAEGTNPMRIEGAAHPGSLKLAHTESEPEQPALPPTTTFQRGQFTFNRRFLETKFAGFFGVVRRDADRDMVLVFKTARGTYVGQRIARIAANELHLQVQKGPASEEVLVPFVEIQEIQLKHKDA